MNVTIYFSFVLVFRWLNYMTALLEYLEALHYSYGKIKGACIICFTGATRSLVCYPG